MTPGLEGEGHAFGPALALDIDELVAIDRLSPRPWTRATFEAELPHLPPTLFVLRAPRRAMAFVVIRVQIPEMDILNLAVAPDLRGRGIGRILVHALLDRASSDGVRKVFLEVRESNHAARRLYGTAGFMETQRRPGFYREPLEDAILMSRPIEPNEGLKGPRNAC